MAFNGQDIIDVGSTRVGQKYVLGHRFRFRSATTYIYADTDGDKKMDFTIHLDDAVKLKDDFFVL
jgi:hypothetical protein